MIARILGQPFTIRRPLLLVTAIVGLTFPAGAMATDTMTTAGVAKTDAFKLSLRIIQGGPGGYGGPIPNSVTGVLNKKSEHVTQAASYDFLHGIKFNASKNLSSATVKGNFANGRGSINMIFHATGPVIHPKGCRGRQQGRHGVLQGTYTLHADKLGTITERSFRATLWSAYSPGCGSRSSPGRGYLLFTPRFNKPSVRVSKSSATGHVNERIEVERSTRNSFMSYSYLVTGEPGADYKVSPNLLSAHVIGARGISGAATYSATNTSGNNCCSIGKLNGNLGVTMAAIGRVRPFANGPQRASEHRLSGTGS